MPCSPLGGDATGAGGGDAVPMSASLPVLGPWLRAVNQGSWTAVVLLVLSIVGIVIQVLALGVIPRNRKPSTGLAWLMLVMLSPWIGLVAFAFFGRTSVGSKRRHEQADANRQIAARTTDLPDMPVGLVGPEYLATSVHLNRVLGSHADDGRQQHRVPAGLRDDDREDG